MLTLKSSTVQKMSYNLLHTAQASLVKVSIDSTLSAVGLTGENPTTATITSRPLFSLLHLWTPTSYRLTVPSNGELGHTMSPKLTVNESATLVTVFVFQLFIYLFIYLSLLKSTFPQVQNSLPTVALCCVIQLAFMMQVVSLSGRLCFVIHHSSAITLLEQGRPGEGSANRICMIS